MKPQVHVVPAKTVASAPLAGPADTLVVANGMYGNYCKKADHRAGNNHVVTSQVVKALEVCNPPGSTGNHRYRASVVCRNLGAARQTLANGLEMVTTTRDAGRSPLKWDAFRPAGQQSRRWALPSALTRTWRSSAESQLQKLRRKNLRCGPSPMTSAHTERVAT